MQEGAGAGVVKYICGSRSFYRKRARFDRIWVLIKSKEQNWPFPAKNILHYTVGFWNCLNPLYPQLNYIFSSSSCTSTRLGFSMIS